MTPKIESIQSATLAELINRASQLAAEVRAYRSNCPIALDSAKDAASDLYCAVYSLNCAAEHKADAAAELAAIQDAVDAGDVELDEFGEPVSVPYPLYRAA